MGPPGLPGPLVIPRPGAGGPSLIKKLFGRPCRWPGLPSAPTCLRHQSGGRRLPGRRERIIGPDTWPASECIRGTCWHVGIRKKNKNHRKKKTASFPGEPFRCIEPKSRTGVCKRPAGHPRMLGGPAGADPPLWVTTAQVHPGPGARKPGQPAASPRCQGRPQAGHPKAPRNPFLADDTQPGR